MDATNESGWYEIRLRGHLDERWASWFDGMAIDRLPGGVTRMSGRVADQAALHGLLARLRDLGVPIISVTLDPAGDDGARA